MIGWLVGFGVFLVCFGVGTGNPFLIAAGFMCWYSAWDRRDRTDW